MMEAKREADTVVAGSAGVEQPTDIEAKIGAAEYSAANPVG
jgi:hypothetical protein